MRFGGGISAVAAGILLAGTVSVHADEATGDRWGAREQSRWYLQFGPGYIDFLSKGKITLAGQRIAGAGAAASDNVTLAASLGYFVTPDISVLALLGIPPETKVQGRGDLNNIGTLGKATYGPAMIAVNYHYRDIKYFQPFAGLGFTYTPVFHSKDGVLKNLQVDDTVGPVLRAGFEVMLTENMGLFADVNRIFYMSKARGTLNGIPASAKLDLNPFIVHTGVTYHF